MGEAWVVGIALAGPVLLLRSRELPRDPQGAALGSGMASAFTNQGGPHRITHCPTGAH